jgi:hypothetical protein
MSNVKGALNGLCNRSACLKPGANYYNHSTREHYCVDCAAAINNMNPESHQIYGHDLCTLVEQTREDMKNESDLNALESQSPEQ